MAVFGGNSLLRNLFSSATIGLLTLVQLHASFTDLLTRRLFIFAIPVTLTRTVFSPRALPRPDRRVHCAVPTSASLSAQTIRPPSSRMNNDTGFIS